MAVLDSILVAGQSPDLKIAAIVSGNGTTEQLLGENTIFVIHGTGAFHIKFGKTSMAAAATGDFLIPADTLAVFAMGKAFTHVRLFNDSGANIDIYIKQLSRF